MNIEPLPWNLLRSFRAVAEKGSLSQAGKTLNLSQPTVGRHISALEKEVGAALFDCSDNRRTLTPVGAQLLPLVDDMNRSARAIDLMLQDQARARETVRIACGLWMGRYLARHLALLKAELPEIDLSISSAYDFTDVGRQESAIALRNRRPEKGRIVRRLVTRYSYAVYGGARYIAMHPNALDDRRYGSCDWAGLDEAHDHFPTMRWLAGHLPEPPRYRFSQSTDILEAVKGDAALGVLPCYIADGEPGLVRACEPFVPEKGGGVWLLVNEDLGRLPHIRSTVDALSAFIKNRKADFLPE